MNFETDFYWHDLVIKSIDIDRNNPGNNDVVSFEIDWYDKGLRKLIFEDVYLLQMNMNFGIVANESIDAAFIANENDEVINNFYKKWNGLMNDVKPLCYVIKTSSTGSEIKIFAKGFREEAV